MRTCFLFFRKGKKTRLAEFGEYFFSKSLSLSICFVNKLAFFFRVSNRSQYLFDHYIVWTDFTNLIYSVGVESLVRH